MFVVASDNFLIVNLTVISVTNYKPCTKQTLYDGVRVINLWFLTPLSTKFRLSCGVQFGGNGCTHRKPLTNFITKCCVEYTSP